MHHNITNLYIIKASKWFMLIMPIVVLFYNANGLNQFEIFVLQGIYSLSIVLLEIPSGYFADILGRRHTILIGSVLGFLGFFTYSFSEGFYGFMVAEIILGIGQSMISGADSAILYDTLAHQQRTDQYLRYEGKMSSIGNFSEALAGITGGLLATISLRTPYYFQTAIMLFSIPAAWRLVEPPQTHTLDKPGWQQIKAIVKNTLVTHKVLRFNILFSAVTGAATLTMAWFVQPFFKVIELPLAWYGVLWTLLNLTVGLVSWYAHHIEKRMGQRQTLTLITLLIAVTCILTGLVQSYWGLIFLFLFYMLRGLATPVLKDYINKMTESHVRATVLSIRNFIIRFVFAFIGPVLGYLTDKLSLQYALILAGTLFLCFGLISLYFFVTVLKPQKS